MLIIVQFSVQFRFFVIGDNLRVSEDEIAIIFMCIEFYICKKMKIQIEIERFVMFLKHAIKCAFPPFQ